MYRQICYFRNSKKDIYVKPCMFRIYNRDKVAFNQDNKKPELEANSGSDWIQSGNRSDNRPSPPVLLKSRLGGREKEKRKRPWRKP